MDHWSYGQLLLTEEEMEVHTDNYMKPGNVHGGFNYYRANLSVTSNPWSTLDLTSSNLPVTMLWGVGDPVVPPVSGQPGLEVLLQLHDGTDRGLRSFYDG